MNCPQCGVDVVAGSDFCHKCGAKLISEAPVEPADRLRQAAAAKQNAGDEPEKELWSGSYSAKDMIGAWLGAAAVTALLAIGGFIVANVLGLAAGLGIGAVLWICLLGYLAYQKLATSYQLTSERFIHKTGILMRTTNRIEVLDMDDVTFTQGIIERFVGTGTITILSSDKSHPKLVMPGIDRVQEVSELIDNTRRAERRRRGLHIEAI